MQKIPDIVLYHADCHDGFGAAWAIQQAVLEQGSGMPIFVPVQYNKPLPAIDYRCDLLFIVDFSLPRDQLDQLSALAGKIVIIDHHKSAEEDLRDVQKFYLGQNVTELPYDILAHFDRDHSGAVLTWAHFHKGKPVPELLAYIEDRDIWRWDLPHTHEVNAFLGTVTREFKDFNLADVKLVHHFDTVVATGKSLLSYQRQLINQVVSHGFLAAFRQWDVAVVCSPILHSEVGNRLCEMFLQADFAIVFPHPVKEGEAIKLSLRSIGDFDVSAVARLHGGGGHRNAAGCTLTAEEWETVRPIRVTP